LTLFLGITRAWRIHRSEERDWEKPPGFFKRGRSFRWEARTVALRELAKDTDEEHRRTDIFWFASKSVLSLENPQVVLLGDIWTTAAGERGSIF
jgi:hypothetical protein